MQRKWTLCLVLSIFGGLWAGMQTTRAPAAAQELLNQSDISGKIWRRIEWSGHVLVWRYSATDHLVGGATRIFWKLADDDQVLAFTGSLGVAILEMELSEGIDIAQLLDKSPYLDGQYITTVLSILDDPDFDAASWVPASAGLVLGRRYTTGSAQSPARTIFAIDPCIIYRNAATRTTGVGGAGHTHLDQQLLRFLRAVAACDPCPGNDPCCDTTDPCCDDPDPCCDDPLCCGDPDCCEGPCCNNPDPCCDDPDPCCPDPCVPECDDGQAQCQAGCPGSNPDCCDDPCCGDPCCQFPSLCCDNPDPCCENPDPCACSGDPCSPLCNPDPCDPACGGDPVCDPACGGDPCAPECNPKPCTSPCADPCDPQCVNCDDDNPCTTDSCSGGTCSNDPIDCDDGNACTTDSCAPGTGTCTHEEVICDDGDACNGVETCDPAIGCLNQPVDDKVTCGACNECDPATGECVEENHSTTFTQAGIIDGTLWWFDGESQQQYSTQVTIEAVDLSDGKFHWIIAPESQPRVDFENGQDEIIKQNINTVELISTGSSQQENDIIIILIHDDCEEQTSGFSTTVYAPDSMQFQFVTDEPWIVGSFTGYKSSLHYTILQQFGTVLPRAVDVNETFDTEMVSDFPGETWSDESPQGQWIQADPSDWVDIVAAATQAGATPPAQVPQVPLGNVKVQHNEGTFRVGSQAFGQGVPVKTVTWQFYKDHGRHE